MENHRKSGCVSHATAGEQFVFEFLPSGISEKGCEAIMRIMDTVGESELLNMKGKYIRVAHKGWGDTVKIIGNIIKDKWFDYGTFFEK